MVPFVYCQKYNFENGSTASMQQRINSSYGSTLLRTYFDILTELNDSYITEYNTYMDELRLQDLTLKIADGLRTA